MGRSITEQSYEQLIELAYKDADAAIERVGGLLDPEMVGTLSRARLHRVLSIAHRLKGELDQALAQASTAEDLARTSTADDLIVASLLDRAGALTLSGRMSEADAAIDEAEKVAVDDRSRALCRFQRGFLRLIEGRLREARPLWEDAATGFEDVGDQLNLRKTLQNLGGICAELGDLDAAEKYQEDAFELASRADDLYALIGINQHRGRLASYRGDLPRALRILEEAERIEEEISEVDVPRHVTRAEVLTSAGLFAEATHLATRIARRNEEEGDSEHAGNAWLIASRAALFDGDPVAAYELANRAVTTFDDAGRSFRVSEAKLQALQARAQIGSIGIDDVAELGGILDQLEQGGQSYSLAEARLVAGQVFLDAGETDKATSALRALAGQGRGPVEMQLFSSLAAATLAQRSGDNVKVARAARTGLDAVDRVQQAMGSTELRMGVEKHSRELGAIALHAALQSGRPRRVLSWMERTRARFLRFATEADGPTDPEIDRLASELRRTDHSLRNDHADQRQLMARRRRLQDQLATRHRLVRARQTSSEPFDVDALVDSLGDRTLVEIADSGGRLHAVVADRGRCRLVELGETEDVVEQVRHLRFSMRRAARLGRDVDPSALRSIDEALGPLFAGDSSEFVIVPPAFLMAMPWSWLPRLRSRQVVVNSSAELWWRAERAPGPGSSKVVVAGGPDLKVARREVLAVAAVHDRAVALAPGVSVESVSQAMDGASLVHVAAHARFEPHNPMFSALRLGDGDLNLYDIQRLSRPPTTVVLSACDSGYSDARPGQELAGLTSALLSIGARNVVASVGLVPDSEATCELMVDVHRGLVGGEATAPALSRAQERSWDDPDRLLSAASFICIGA